MNDQEIIVYGTTWCGDCFRIKLYLKMSGIPYRWINIDHDKDGEQLVLRINHGMRSVPTIVFANGDVLVEPSIAQFEAKFRSRDTS